MIRQKNGKQVEFGDFQTPKWFSDQVCMVLNELGIRPAIVVEPTCGYGNFVLSALEYFPSVSQVIGLDINPQYVQQAQSLVTNRSDSFKVTLSCRDFFDVDWNEFVAKLPDPLLFVGNLPWVTNSELATLGSNNLPVKSNFQRLSGIDAITGSSNFDISEWMLLQLLEAAPEREVIVAMLCKTTVARKVLHHIWGKNAQYGRFRLYQINAKQIFGANVHACLFIYDGRSVDSTKFCEVYQQFSDATPQSVIGFRKKKLIANIPLYERWQHLENNKRGTLYVWRSGVKHDCAKVMELTHCDGVYVNKLGEVWELEQTYLYPLAKSSDVARSAKTRTESWLLVTQHAVGDSTQPIQLLAPQTWAYLIAHGAYLDNRKSTVYKESPRFSIFGVGNYSFAPWKVAISGLYKRIHFEVIGPYEGKPTMLDDTCYFVPCNSAAEANLIAGMLNSEPAQSFLQSLIFWDAKRPITANLLRTLDLETLACELNQLGDFQRLRQPQQEAYPAVQQLRLLEQRACYETNLE